MISVAKLKEAVPAAVGVDSGLLEQMIARATAFVESQTRRYFGLPVEVTEYLPGSGGRVLRLSEPLVEQDSDVEITLLEERGYPGGEGAVIAETGFSVRTRNPVPISAETVTLLVRAGGPIWTNGYEYAVTYMRGYEVDEGPKDIEQLIIDLVEVRLPAAGEERLQSETIGGYSYTRFKETDLDLIDDGRETIAAWRRAVFA